MRYTLSRRPFFTVESAIGIKRYRGHISYLNIDRNPLKVLGRTVQQTAVPPTPILSGMANETTLDTWSYDSIYGAGDVGLIKRQHGSNSASPASNPTESQGQVSILLACHFPARLRLSLYRSRTWPEPRQA